MEKAAHANTFPLVHSSLHRHSESEDVCVYSFSIIDRLCADPSLLKGDIRIESILRFMYSAFQAHGESVRYQEAFSRCLARLLEINTSLYMFVEDAMSGLVDEASQIRYRLGIHVALWLNVILIEFMKKLKPQYCLGLHVESYFKYNLLIAGICFRITVFLKQCLITLLCFLQNTLTSLGVGCVAIFYSWYPALQSIPSSVFGYLLSSCGLWYVCTHHIVSLLHIIFFIISYLAERLRNSLLQRGAAEAVFEGLRQFINIPDSKFEKCVQYGCQALVSLLLCK